MGLIYNLGLRIINFLVIFLIVILFPNLPPKVQFPFKEFHVTPSRDLSGPLALNNHLDKTERLLEGRVYGPEALLGRKNEIYTTIHGGEVIKITADHITHVAKFGQPCEAIYEEATCGRPLGMAFDTLGDNLIVADAYYGIWQVDLKNGKKKLLISPDETLEGKIKRRAKVFNSVAVDKRGDLYWTDSSSDFTLEDGMYTLFANPSGRLFHYDRVKNVSRLLVDELFFANGVALSPKEDFVVVSETGASRLLKYNLQGQKKGQVEVFADGLPGVPDNLTPDADGLWVPLVTSRDAEHPAIHQSLAGFPMLRMFLLRMFALFEMPFRFANNVFPNKFSRNVLHFAGHFESASLILPKRATILRIDWNGNIKGSLHGFDGSAGYISHVLEMGDSLYLGSPFNRFLGKTKLPRGPQIKVKNVRVEGMEAVAPQTVHAKPSVEKTATQAQPTTQKPTTTTTPKPTTTRSPTTTPKPTTTQKPTTTTTTTPKPKTTTPRPTTKTPMPTTTKKPTTTTAKPATETVKQTQPPKQTTTTAKPSATATPPVEKPAAPTKPSVKPPVKLEVKMPPKPESVKEPAPIKEEVVTDTRLPKAEKLKVIKKGGVHGEL